MHPVDRTSSTGPTSGEAVVGRLFAAVDAGDVDALVALFAPDASQRIGNADWSRGREAIRAGNEAFLSLVTAVRHEVTGLWESEGTVLVRSEVSYDLHDGRSVTLPSMSAFTSDADGLISSFQVWSDTAPLRTG